ncbi:MAG: DNA polymerase, partial [Clostridiales bacterium]|nr:DNA polymerase [Clostridiales bacterium]
TGRLHTSFKQTVTATGRLSSAEPNLQNIPVRLEQGRRLRQAFVPREGNLLLAGDYNQIELRVLAHVSGDEKLIEAFNKGEDIHTRTACEIFDVAPDQVDALMRRQAKAVNFGIIYGISDFGLARDLGIGRQQAREYIEKYLARYPAVEEFHRRTIAQGKKDGYVATILGRRRYLPDLSSPNYNLRGLAERMAVNAPIQGGAADIIKIAMINIAAKISELGLKSCLLLQVHDELIFDMEPAESGVLPELVRNLMSGAVALAVPVVVDMKTGPNWYDMTKIQEARHA